jgi:hypothetical protein
MWRVVMRCVMVRSAMLFAVMHLASVRSAVAIVVAVGIMAMLGLIAAAAVIAASMAMIEVAMFAPAVTIPPTGPWAHTQEDAVVEVILPVKSPGSASVWPSFVVAPLADWWFADFDGWNAYLDGNLCASRWRHGQARKQCCRAE